MNKLIESPQEAWQALADGEIVVNADAQKHKISGSVLQYQSSGPAYVWLVTNNISPGPWRIAKQEPAKPEPKPEKLEVLDAGQWISTGLGEYNAMVNAINWLLDQHK